MVGRDAEALRSGARYLDTLALRSEVFASRLTYRAAELARRFGTRQGVRVVLGSAGQSQQRFHGRNEDMAAHLADAFTDQGQVEKGYQFGGVFLAAGTAHRLLGHGLRQPGPAAWHHALTT
jgi:hypothetical protein